jgi:hypothetical protein
MARLMRKSTDVTVFESTLIPASVVENPLEDKLSRDVALEPFALCTHNAAPVTLKIQTPTAAPVSFVRAKIDAEASYLRKNGGYYPLNAPDRRICTYLSNG